MYSFKNKFEKCPGFFFFFETMSMVKGFLIFVDKVESKNSESL